jgi:hypothetical protein
VGGSQRGGDAVFHRRRKRRCGPPTICSRYTPSISFLKTGSANLLPVSLDTSERPSSLRDQTGASLFSDVISS